ncbi:MAG: biopolymer transporter ExbD [Elainella sp. C42_A2020_010]|nr:biopolymer transporter ExbD [Elainella sp. C42_A2020_010]
MKIDLDSTEPDVRIEIVPLIDVIFCILTFFILAAVTLTRQAAINVDLPRAASGTTQMRQILIVSVDPIGQAYVEKLPVTKDQLYQAIVNFRQQNPEGMMVLYASRAASYNDVVQVLDLLRSAGGDRVALATLPGEGDTPNAPNTPFPDLPSGTTVPNGSLSPTPLPTPGANPFNLDTFPTSPGGDNLPSPEPNGSSGSNPADGLGSPSGLSSPSRLPAASTRPQTTPSGED